MATKKPAAPKLGYVDGFVLCVPEKNLAAYKRMATIGGNVWMDHGALQYVEASADDYNAPGLMSFKKLANPKKGETVIFSWVVYKSKSDRAKILKKVMADPRLQDEANNMIFDMKRMAYGGFKMLVHR